MKSGPKTKTTSQYIEDAKAIWGDKYDYSKVEYTGCDDKILIKCRKHGYFSIRANSHLRGYGCKVCARENRPQKVRGVGTNDAALILDDPIYKIWHGILNRVTSTELRFAPYYDVTIYPSWLSLSTFRKWCLKPSSGYMEGYEIDKDIIMPGSKIYSPKTCCFVPTEINLLFVKHQSPSGNPTGVHEVNGRFVSQIKYNDKIYSSSYGCIEDAMNDYVLRKTEVIQKVAQDYYSRKLITQKVYDAMMRFPVRDYLTNHNQIII